MDKNPISFLQEWLAQQHRIQPIYDLVSEVSGTHENTFTFKLTCGTWPSVTQTGSSKKEAKKMAAVAMLKQIVPDYYDNSTSSKITSSNITSDLQVPSSNTSWISKLQEFVSNKPIAYDCVAVTGPSHNPRFTVKCSYLTLSTEAVACSKKEAKSLSAKLMLEKLKGTVGNMDGNFEANEYLNSVLLGIKKIQIEDDIFETNSAKKAKIFYSQLSRTNHKKPSKSIHEMNFKQYYNYLREDLENSEIYDIEERLRDIIKCCQNLCSSENNYFHGEKPLKLFKMLAQDLQINFKTRWEVYDSVFSYWIMLDNAINTTEIGLGENLNQAETVAILQISVSLLITLS